MPRPASQATAPETPVAELGPEIKFAVWHQRCARCGHPAALGMMLTDGAGTGPWLCWPNPTLGRAGCRQRPRI